MRRLVGVAVVAALAGAAMAQSFTIRTPVEGATVREMVKVKIPKGSIPEGSYIGVSVNGKFLEASLPPIDEANENYVYTLDTKGRKLPDGDMDIEVMLYMNFNDRTEIVNRSSVRVTLDNHTSIKIPPEGIRLRYKFIQGQEIVYKHTISQSVGLVSQAQATLGSRAGELPQESEEFRILYAFDNVYVGEDGNPEALLRMQGLPDKGKSFTFIIASGDTEAVKYYDYEMHPLYMRIQNTGREVWGSAPPYFPMNGTTGESARTDLYLLAPLPILPSKTLYPGDVWQAQHLFSDINLDRLHELDSLTMGLRSRGTLIGVEWEKGIPCAKFSVEVDAGAREMANAVNLNQQPGDAQRVSLKATVWFALDRGIIVKSEVEMLQESLVTVGTATG
ncbi:MAG: hypothetical protein IH945_02470, partial [Armatimonadetes bacterium]|nr:hypothetical protein [Armatimonadota bacterium]